VRRRERVFVRFDAHFSHFGRRVGSPDVQKNVCWKNGLAGTPAVGL
jgi:hypothetical protein